MAATKASIFIENNFLLTIQLKNVLNQLNIKFVHLEINSNLLLSN